MAAHRSTQQGVYLIIFSGKVAEEGASEGEAVTDEPSLAVGRKCHTQQACHTLAGLQSGVLWAEDSVLCVSFVCPISFENGEE